MGVIGNMKSCTCRRSAVFALYLMGLSLSPVADAANLLRNSGFETEYPGGLATNWWYYGAAGRATWAQWSGVAGNAFNAPGNSLGGFGQIIGIASSNGDVFTFHISGKAEPNYVTSNTTIALEFYIGGALNYAITRNVYDLLDSSRDSWVFLTLTHTNAVPGIDEVRVRCDFADCTIPGGTLLGTCQWDEGRLFQTQARTSSVPQLAKYEPLSGAYLGVVLDRGGTAQEIAELNQDANKRHAVYAKFLLFDQDPFPWDWVNTVKTSCPGAAVHLVLEPMVGFTNFYAADWGPGQATYAAALSFASNCALADMPVFLRFGHEANGDWYPWHPQYSVKYNIPDTVSNETYITAWRNFANLIHSNAPNVAMVWAPNQGNGPDPLPFYEDVYPGDQYVDWVGMSVYNGRTYGNGDEVLDFQFKKAIEKGYWQENDNNYDDTFENFYWTFSDPDNPEGHHKPMMIAETAAAFEPKYLVTNQILIAGFESLDGPAFSSSNTLAQFQSLNSDGWVVTNGVWADGFDDLTTWNWGPWGTNGYTWTGAEDRVEGTGALRITGQPEAGGTYLGGNGRTIDSISFAPVKTLAEFQDLNSDGLELSGALTVDTFENLTVWNWGPWGNMFWSNSSDCVQGVNAAHMGGAPNPGEAYIGGNGRTYDPDWSMNNGMQIWAKCDSSARPYPILTVGLRCATPPGTATASRVITSESYGPEKIFFSNMTVSAGFNWSNIWDFTLELLTTESGSRPRDVRVDQWSRGTLSGARYKDQDWWPGGMSCTPWADAGDTHTWTLVSDPYASYPSNSLKISGTDINANSYIGGNGCAIRPEDRDWSGAAHFALIARRAAGGAVDPMLRVELLDGNSRTSASTIAFGGSTYARQVIAFTGMVTDVGFSWTNVATMKLHTLTAVAGSAPADLYLKQLQLGTASSNRTPTDWSGYEGMELYVKRDADAKSDPVLGITVRSEAGVTGTATVQRVITGTNYYPVRIAFSELSQSPGFTFTNISVLVIESYSSASSQEPAACQVDIWRLVNLVAVANPDQDWWPAGTNDAPWADVIDTNGGWNSWTVVEDNLDGFPANALRMSGADANTNFYIGGNGFSLRDADKDWSRVTYLSLLARRGDITNAEPMLLISLLDSTGTHTAQVTQVIVDTNYMALRIPFREMLVSPGFQWTNVSSVTFEMLTGTPGRRPSDMYLKEFQIGTASNEYEQDWWTAGSGYQPWGDSMWTQSTDAAVGQHAVRISGTVTNDSQWYIGGNGCSIAIAQQNWSNSDALMLYAKRGDETNKVYPKFKITLDNDYSETNGNEAIIDTKVANSNYYEMVIAFDDFLADEGFSWTNVRMFKIEFFTGDGGRQPNDLYIDQLQRTSITLTNGADNIKWKHDWCDQLYALENFQDSDPADPDQNPDYVNLFEHFRNVHMINWFHVKKFEDGITKDLKIAADGTNGGVVFASYSDRVKESYFLTNIVMDTDGDGMSDSWELRYFSGPTNANALSDRDFDGLNNWDEYLAGSNPTSDYSVLEMDSGAVSSSGSSGFVIQWQSEPWRTYSLQWSTNLDRSFGTRANLIVATPPVNAYTDMVTGVGPYFYRVKVVP
jgi:hypothetical protein